MKTRVIPVDELRVGDVIVSVNGNEIPVGPVTLMKVTDAHRGGRLVARRLYVSHPVHRQLAPRDVRLDTVVEIEAEE